MGLKDETVEEIDQFKKPNTLQDKTNLLMVCHSSLIK